MVTAGYGHNFPIDDIEIEYFIVKRKLHNHPDYPNNRIQTYTPAAGKIKLNKAVNAVNEFAEKYNLKLETFKKDANDRLYFVYTKL